MENLILKIKKLGFKEYEAKVFLALLKNVSLSASEIADKAKIRRTAVYEILKSFAEKGYCNAIETNSILKYEIINPNIIFDKIQGEINHAKETELTHLKDTFHDLHPLYHSDKPLKVDTQSITVKDEKVGLLCKDCGKSYKTESALKGHITREHSNK